LAAARGLTPRAAAADNESRNRVSRRLGAAGSLGALLVFSENAILFLRHHQDSIVERWQALGETSLNPDFMAGSWFNSEMLSRLFDQLIEALDRRVYRDLNRTIETLVNSHETPSPLDVKELLARFAQAVLEVFNERESTLKDTRTVRADLASIARTLRRVYAERLCPQLISVLSDNRDDLRERWLRDLPTPRISDHFSMLAAADRAAFVDATMAIYDAILRGREEDHTAHPNEPERSCTLYENWVIRQVDFFTPKGFGVVDLISAVEHLPRLLEPLVARATAHDVWTYRVSSLLLDDARDLLVRGFADAYVERFSRGFYGEVGIMLHRIKNKLTSVPSTMATVLAVATEQYGQMFEPMIMTVEEAELYCRYDGLVQEVLKAVTAVADADDPTEGLGPLRSANHALADFLATEGARIENIRLMKLDVGSAEIVHEMLGIVLEGGLQTQQLTEDLQLRMNALYERETPRWEPLAISELVKEACDEAAVDARARNINFNVEDSAQGLRVYGIKREIGRPFVQMIDNAIKYTPNGGDVTVTLSPDGDGHVLFKVKDTGIGIPPGEEEQVFSLCERCSNAKDFAAGTGTGLYHDRITVMHHNGEMWCESGGLGAGSTFYIRLPVHREAQVPEAKAA
jgi:signal transduction histidine kinase